MKILTLNLTAFGPFTDTTLDLSGGKEGLHVIYGPNEAGKSSTLRAITDFFYGIHSRTPDNFIHPYPRLRIGAQLKCSDGTVLDLVRRKANQNSLLLGDDTTPVDESELSRFLGDVDRELFQVMFGIDHEQLRRGGERIVQGSGRIGELLFAAGAGIADLQKVQATLHAEIDELLKSSGRAGSIAVDIKEFQKYRTAVKDAQISVETWKRHDKDLRAAQTKKHTLDEDIREKRTEQNRLARIRDAVAAIGRWKKAADDLAGVRDVPILADDFADTSNGILIELRKAEQQQQDAKADIARLDGQLEKVCIPKELVNESDAIELLRDRLGSYRKAMADGSKLETLRELSENEAKEILRKLGRTPDLSTIEKLRLPADKTVRIQNLGNQQEGLLERLQSSRRDCERIRREISQAESNLKDIRVPAEATGLRTSLHDIQKEGDLESQLDEVCNALQGLERNAKVALSQLPLWSGSLEEAEALAVPLLKTVERFDDERKETLGRLESQRDRLREAIAAREDLEAQLTQLELEQKVPTNAELEAKRHVREQGWQLVLKAWKEGQEDEGEVTAFLKEFAPLKGLSEAYHRSVDEADQAADILRNDAERVAIKVRLQVDREQQLSREAAISAEIEQVEAELRDNEDQWETTWQPLGITPLSPLEMRDWLRQQQEISQAAGRIRAKQLEAEQLQQRIDSLLNKLTSALKQVEPEFANNNRSLRELLLIASGKYDDVQKAESLREQTTDGLESSRSELAEVELRFAESELALTKWQSAWADEMARLGLADDAMPPQANSVLADISRLFQKYQEADQFRTRVEAIDRDAREFETDVLDLAGRVVPDLATKPVEEVVSLLTSQLQAGRSAEENQDSLSQRRIEQETKLRIANGQISEFKASLDEMCRQAGCATHEELSEAARQSGRRNQLERSVRDLEQQILDQSGGADFKAFVAEVEKEAADADSLRPRIEELDRDLVRLGAERDEAVSLIRQEELELRKIDGSAFAAEQEAKCQSIAARLEDQVQELAVLRVASAVLHAGIEQHRKKNQGPVLGRASEIFSQVTLGTFKGLRADFNERGEPVLTGIRSANGDTILVSGMSDGTCDQLYLALRLASFETWLDHHEAIPFIVDDVLLNFDDERAIASLQVLAELSHRTQVIFFTHHNHLVEMAQNNLASEDLFVQTLANGATAAG